MSYYQEADITPMLEEFGIDLTLGSNTISALRDEADEEILASVPSPIVGKGTVFTIYTGSLAGAVSGGLMSSEGVNYKISAALQSDDGAITRLVCQVVP